MDSLPTSTGSAPKRPPADARGEGARASGRPASRGTGASDAPNRVRAVPRSRLGAHFIALAAAAIVVGWTAPAAAQLKLLEPERAFAFAARGVDERTVEARFVVADGYYLYRDKLRFSVDGALLGATAALPPGKVKQDEFFGNVETYRGMLVVKLPLEAAAPGRSLTVRAESQGCADVGVCYPPQVQQVTIAMPAAGAKPGFPVEAAPEKKRWFN
jgi:thiol:disulfide interchange protein